MAAATNAAARDVQGARWELHAIRNRRGLHTCELQAPDGSWVAEPLADCAARAGAREWANPAAEVEHMVTLSAFLAARTGLGGRGSRYCVLYLVGRKERRSPWFWNPGRAEQARRLVEAKHGRAIVYVD